jgi:hypothetical protein
MKLSLLAAAVTLVASPVAALGTVRLLIWPDVIDMSTAPHGQTLKDALYEAIDKTCTCGPVSTDPGSQIVWVACKPEAAQIKIGENTVTVKVAGSWRQDNPGLRKTLINAVSSAFMEFHHSSPTSVPNQLTLETGIVNENWMHVNLSCTNDAGAQCEIDGSFKFGKTDVKTLSEDGTRALDPLMTEFNDRLGGGSTTRVVTCLDNNGAELRE